MVSLSNKMSLKYPLTDFVSRHVSGAWIKILDTLLAILLPFLPPTNQNSFTSQKSPNGFCEERL